jgi:hypothetical protein
MGPFKWQLQDTGTAQDGITTVEVRSGDISDVTYGWNLYDGASSFVVVGRRLFTVIAGDTSPLTYHEDPALTVQSDGRIVGSKPFLQSDVGRVLSIANSLVPFNNYRGEIYAVDPATPTVADLALPIVISGVDANGGVRYVPRPGTQGLVVSQVADLFPQDLAVVVILGSIAVYLQTDSSGTILSTASQVVSTIAASPQASALVTATAIGTGASVAGTTDEPVPILGARLLQDGGPLYAALFPYGQLDLQGVVSPAGVIIQEGVDLVVTLHETHLGVPSTQLTSSSAKFALTDIGNLLTISGSLLGSNGNFPITDFANNTSVWVPGTLTVGEANLTWVERAPTYLVDSTQVQVNDPGQLQYLSQDFGFITDNRHSEFRQRLMLQGVTQWPDFKGGVKGYTIVANISGFDATVTQLYRASAALYQQILAVEGDTAGYLISSPDLGTWGLDGKLTLDGSVVRFHSPSAKFTAGSIGRHIVISNASTSSNNRPGTTNELIFTIGSFIDVNTVDFIVTDTATCPDYGVGGSATTPPPALHWWMVRLYATSAPFYPNYDDVNIDAMQAIVGAEHFRADMFCSDPEFISYYDVQITSVVLTSSSGPLNTYTLTVNPPAAPLTYPGAPPSLLPVNRITSLAPGNPSIWSITDSAGNNFVLESVPNLVSGNTYTVTVVSTSAPAVDVVGTSNSTFSTVHYSCPGQFSCDFCQSNRVYIQLTEDSIANETGLARELAFQRLAALLETEVKPVHVDLVLAFVGRVDAALDIEATVTTP